MFGVIRGRRDANRNKKLEEQFLKKDSNGNGRITAEQMIQIFQENEIQVPDIEKKVAKLPDKEGWIRINEFLKFSLATDLCKIEFHDKVFGGELDDNGDEKKTKTDAKKESKPSKPAKVKFDSTKMDRVEQAFRKFDINKDGYLSRDEFDLMMKNVSKEQADRIFGSIDTAGDNKISLEEFRTMMSRGDLAQK